MKLIAETEYENQVIHGLTNLLRDLGVNAEGFRKEESVACTFWSPEDLILEFSAINNSSPDNGAGFLLAIEDKLRFAMISAGYEVISEELFAVQSKQT